jgi:signal peptidase I
VQEPNVHPEQSQDSDLMAAETPSTQQEGSTIWELLQTLLVAAILFLAVNMVTARIRVEGKSMEPTLVEGQFILINRLAYRWGEMERGDIIVFHFPFDHDRRLIKRLIGLPGDTITASNGVIYVNGVPLDEPYIADAPVYNDEWIVGPDEVFVLGDNRNNSSDSHLWGKVPFSQIVGKAILIYWPPDDFGPITHHNLMGASQAAQP